MPIDKRDPPHAVRTRLLHEHLPGALRGKTDQLQLVAALEHVERLGADRAGGTEDEQALSHRHLCCNLRTWRVVDQAGQGRSERRVLCTQASEDAAPRSVHGPPGQTYANQM